MPAIICEIPGCYTLVEIDKHDYRPWVYHTINEVNHCAGKNPNYWEKPKLKQIKTFISHKRNIRDHILQEYFGYDYFKHKKEKEEDEEI